MNSIERRVAFIEHICRLVENEMLRPLIVELFMGVPSAFWSAPASSSGKYHPLYASGDGGLLRHTLVCIHVARDLVQAYGVREGGLQMHAVTLAAAFHDTYKGGDTGTALWTETLARHPYIAAERLNAINQNRPFSVRTTLVWAEIAVVYHMSMWSVIPRGIAEMPLPAQIVSTADYIASRKYFEPSAELAELVARFQ